MNIWFLIYVILLVLSTGATIKERQEEDESIIPNLFAFALLFIIVYLAVRKGI